MYVWSQVITWKVVTYNAQSSSSRVPQYNTKESTITHILLRILLFTLWNSILFISFVLYQKQQSIFALFGCFHLFEHFRTSLASGRHWECRKMKHGPSLELFSYPFLSWFFFITYLSLTTPCNTYSKQNSHDFNTNFFIHFDWNVILPYMSFCIPYSFLSLSTWNKYWHI